MAAADLPPREANIAPATEEPAEGATAGWTPADPAPLGLAGFALTTFVLSMMNANLVNFSKGLPVVLGLTLAYGGIAQLLAGMWEFRNGNTFGAVAFSSYGAFWISFFFLVSFDLAKIAPSEVNSALGLYLWSWAIFTAYMTIASLRTTAAVALVFVLLTITYILLGIGNSGGSASTIHLGGYVGIATAAAAWYASMAAVVNSTWGRTVLPVVPLHD
ncbi:MAG TPA: acetate uptake transporter [Solirubrobacteraceae bacterium]|nr:acetate uptake transporter [Solirubrobacteraceae bacterium]